MRKQAGIPGSGYGLIYGSIWDSSIAEDWRNVLVFMALLSLADADDNVFMGVARLERKTGIPGDVLRAGLLGLLAPDPASRSRQFDGRRIVQLPWVDGSFPAWDELSPRGFHIVNRAYYKRLARRVYMREYMRHRRKPEAATQDAENAEAANAELESWREDAPLPPLERAKAARDAIDEIKRRDP